MEKAIACPTDSAPPERSREYLVKATRQCSLHLRHNYNHEALLLAQQVGRYAHAKRFRRMHAVLRTRCLQIGHLHRENTRQLDQVSLPQREPLDDLLARTGRILAQQFNDKNKLYALHAPKVQCIAKGKA